VGCNEGLERLTTPIQYFKIGNKGDSVAWLEYKLDVGPIAGDGHVKVDQGFIKMEATGNPGVRVRTRKIVHIDPLLPEAQAMFVCASGYATLAAEMMFGNAVNPPATTVRWTPSPLPGSTLGTKGVSGQPGSPPGLASTTLDMWLDCLQDLSDKNMALASKWLDNKLTVDDLIGYTNDVGADLASAPWRYLQKLSQLPLRPTTPGGDT
jgi:hypothetical protein